MRNLPSEISPAGHVCAFILAVAIVLSNFAPALADDGSRTIPDMIVNSYPIGVVSASLTGCTLAVKRKVRQSCPKSYFLESTTLEYSLRPSNEITRGEEGSTRSTLYIGSVRPVFEDIIERAEALRALQYEARERFPEGRQADERGEFIDEGMRSQKSTGRKIDHYCDGKIRMGPVYVAMPLAVSTDKADELLEELARYTKRNCT